MRLVLTLEVKNLFPMKELFVIVDFFPVSNFRLSPKGGWECIKDWCYKNIVTMDTIRPPTPPGQKSEINKLDFMFFGTFPFCTQPFRIIVFYYFWVCVVSTIQITFCQAVSYLVSIV